MSEGKKKKSYRLFKLAKEFNVGIDTLADFLAQKGHTVESSPNTKVDGAQYDLLFSEFASDQKLKEKAEQVKDYHQGLKENLMQSEGPAEGPGKRPAPPEELTPDELKQKLAGKSEAPKKASTEKPAPQPTAAADNTPTVESSTPDPPQQERKAPEVGIKVVGKIDLDAAKKGKKPAPQTASEPVANAPEEAPTEIEKPQPKPVTKEAPKEAPEVVTAADNTPKLQGLKVMGKIDLGKVDDKREKKDKPADNTASSTEEDKRKRKRKRRKAATQVTPNTTVGKDADDSRDDKKRPNFIQTGRPASRKRAKARRERRQDRARQRELQAEEDLLRESILEVTEFLTANELANLMDVNVNEVIAKAMELGYMVSINQRLERDIIELIAEEFEFEVEFLSTEEAFDIDDEDEDDEADLQPRQPIVTVMGHVDHGKTSLLDYIRKAQVAEGEAGGITQHIGAYQVKLDDGRKMTFLDTPGHEAFTAMRARGAQVTDVAIIVVAADDAVMPQTREAINHAQAADVPMVIAINKIDKPGANPNKIYEQLSEMNLLVEAWGGKLQSQEVSAKTGQGIEDLLESVLLEAEMKELKANPDRPARGTVIEAELDKGRGVVTTIVVQKGTLRVGDTLVANQYYGRVKAMLDENGDNMESAGPSVPAQILGLNGVPSAGDNFLVLPSDKEARALATKREQLFREQRIRTHDTRMSLEQVAARSQSGIDFQELKVVVKGDVDGSVEALADSLIKLSTNEIAVNVIMKGVGQISESDVLLASASNAIIIGFQVRPSVGARKLVQSERVDLRLYSVIYDAINEVREAMEGMLAPDVEEKVLGTAEVREVFKITKVGTVAGCKVVDGIIQRNNPVRLIRDGIVIYDGEVDALKRFKDDVKEVKEGFECGISIVNYNDLKVGDLIEGYTRVETKRTLEESAAVKA